MSFIRVQVTIPHATGLPEDSVVNTFAITNSAPSTRLDAAQAFALELDALYTAVASFLHTDYSWNAITVESIDLLDPRPRIPFHLTTIGAGTIPATANNWPAEVSVCLSLVGLNESGANMRRRRGRVYIGPLQIVTGDQPMVPGTLVTTLANAGANLMVNPAYALCVYSRYTHYGVPVGRNIGEKNSAGDPVFEEIPDALPSSFVPVTGVYVDNAWDIQRRRGLKPTVRTFGA